MKEGKNWAQLSDQEAARAYRELVKDANELARNLVVRGMHVQARLDWDEWMLTSGIPKLQVKVLREMVVE